jgi:CHAD domain-containing protein
MKSGYLAFTLNGSADFERLIEEIRVLYSVQEQTVFHIDEQYLDTFDWRMYTNGFALRQIDGRFILASLSGTPVLETDGPKMPKLFWWDFPEGAFRERLASISGNRALCPVLGVVGLSRNFRVRNRDQKMVLRFHLDNGEVFVDGQERGFFAPHLCLEGVRGYQRPFHRVADLLKKNGWQEMNTGECLLDLALRMTDRRPIDYKTKFSDLIRPEQTISQAAGTIGLALHAVMERNLPGILEDIDSEFLHDFRVAIRRTRAVLSQMKKEIPPGQAGVFREEFKWLGSVTGPIRDLDVCLQKEKNYRGLLPESLHLGLTRLVGEIQQQRKTQLVVMQKNLQSARTVNLLANWHEFLITLSADSGWPAGQAPCAETAMKIVWRCFRRLVKDAGEVVNGDHQDATIHTLRIQGKKFRYMSEFFRCFFSTAHMDSLLKDLRELQNDLGDFNDLAVQMRAFEKRKETHQPDEAVRATLVELLFRLAEERERLLQRCVHRCAVFMEQDRMQLFGESIKKKSG